MSKVRVNNLTESMTYMADEFFKRLLLISSPGQKKRITDKREEIMQEILKEAMSKQPEMDRAVIAIRKFVRSKNNINGIYDILYRAIGFTKATIHASIPGDTPREAEKNAESLASAEKHLLDEFKESREEAIESTVDFADERIMNLQNRTVELEGEIRMCQDANRKLKDENRKLGSKIQEVENENRMLKEESLGLYRELVSSNSASGLVPTATVVREQLDRYGMPVNQSDRSRTNQEDARRGTARRPDPSPSRSPRPNR